MGGPPTFRDILRHLRITSLYTPTPIFPMTCVSASSAPNNNPSIATEVLKFLLDADSIACFSELRGRRT